MLRRVVLDINVLVAGLWSRKGASFRLLDQARRGRVEPALSVPLVLEYEMVLKRRARELSLAPPDIDAILDWVGTIGHHQRIPLLWRAILRDPRDELVLELALAAGCRPIVTFNARDFGGAERLGVEIITPAEALRQMGEFR